LRLLAHNSFDSISLREVTKKAGISPTAFYRHFDDMEALGLELVDESFGSLRASVRAARTDQSIYDDAIRGSIAVVAQHVNDHTDHMRFMSRERHGGIRRIRQAIRRELRLFADELAIDLASFPVHSKFSTEDRRMMADLIVGTIVTLSGELTDATEAEGEELVARATQQLRLITLGATRWRSDQPNRLAYDPADR